MADSMALNDFLKQCIHNVLTDELSSFCSLPPRLRLGRRLRGLRCGVHLEKPELLLELQRLAPMALGLLQQLLFRLCERALQLKAGVRIHSKSIINNNNSKHQQQYKERTCIRLAFSDSYFSVISETPELSTTATWSEKSARMSGFRTAQLQIGHAFLV